MPPDHVIHIFQSSPAWWQAWLPLLGSGLVAGVALLGVILSNRVNRDAIARADERAHASWHRDEVLKVVLAVLKTSDSILQAFRYQYQWKDEYANKDNELKQVTDKMALYTSSLELLAPGVLAEKCEALHEALFQAREAVVSYQEKDSGTRSRTQQAREDSQAKVEVAKSARTEFIQAAQDTLDTSGLATR
ncbi:hypothetical protein [Nocardia thailandica]